MSVPRRTPPSTMTGILPGGGFDHLWQTIDRGAKSLFGAPTVIRDDQAVHTVLDRELRISRVTMPLRSSLTSQYRATASRNPN